MDIERYKELEELTHREPHEYMRMKGYNVGNIDMDEFKKYSLLKEQMDLDRETFLEELSELEPSPTDIKDDSGKIQELFEELHSIYSENKEAESIVFDSLFYESDKEMMRKLETELKINGTLKSSHKKPKSSHTKKRKKYKKKKKR